MGIESIFAFIIALILLFIVVKLFAWPLKILFKLVINGVLGAVLLFLVNFIGGSFGINVGINGVTALIAGFFGVPGVIFLVIFKNLL
ncbi:pro-sigmaK processing inhibitor BofA family protein [Clostridium sp. MSJ-4]|uniref:Pro-sigmaK processing inhibitor BofA family protein n=1 Tax=Clostridium simiarum TaxID=2841506 RepID=A0ABS6F142_9CLOT|nr:MULTISPECIES: pro-sigmaK processing inhibitor BofA family protein [Clostridium]MBU5592214.1 pro-sigmaK processing inhibitor BofA family protein [Clostridium simiarum]